MKYELTKEQINKVYDNPELLKELFPNAFLEAGKWYGYETCKLLSIETLFCFSGDYDEDGYPLGYGFDIYKTWCNLSSWGCKNITPATTERVTEALINEAKKRGYKKGVLVRRDWALTPLVRIGNEDFITYHSRNTLAMGQRDIFKEGKWAEIIETELELTLQEIAEKFGVDKVKIKK